MVLLKWQFPVEDEASEEGHFFVLRGISIVARASSGKIELQLSAGLARPELRRSAQKQHQKARVDLEAVRRCGTSVDCIEAGSTCWVHQPDSFVIQDYIKGGHDSRSEIAFCRNFVENAARIA